MKLPSLQQVFENAKAAAERFPLALVCAMVGTLAACLLMGKVGDKEILLKIMAISNLGLPLFLALHLASKVRLKHRQKILGFGLILLVLYYFLYVHGWDKKGGIEAIRYFASFLFCLLLFSLGPFWRGKPPQEAVWHHNYIAFERLHTGFLFSIFLSLTLNIALWAISALFGLDIALEVIKYVSIVIFGTFNSWFFLAGVVPKPFEPPHVLDPPRKLKTFARFILVPVVILYVVILYLYLGKIVVQFSLPLGWVSHLVTWCAVLGILVVLLAYPIHHLQDFRWSKTFTRRFFIALLPLVGLQSVGIYRRIFDYGLTENRIIIALGNAWLYFICLYFIFSKTKRVVVVPLTLALLTLAPFHGPWNIFCVSYSNQLHRLESALESAGGLVNGKAQRVTQKLSQEQEKSISSIIRYLLRAHKRTFLEHHKDWFDPPRAYDSAPRLIEEFGIAYRSKKRGRYFLENLSQGQSSWIQLRYRSEKNSVQDISGYNQLYNLNIHSNQVTQTFSNVIYRLKGNELEIDLRNGKLWRVNYNEYLSRLYKKYGDNEAGIAPADLTITSENQHGRLKIIVENTYASSLLDAQTQKRRYKNIFIQGKVLVGE